MPAMAILLPRRGLADHFDAPFSFTFIGFLCVGSSLVISRVSLFLPFLVGENVTVTGIDELEATVKELLSIENAGLCGPLTVTRNGPVPVLVTTTGALTGTFTVVLRLSECGDTLIRPPPGVGVEDGVAVAVGVAATVGLAVAEAVAVAVLVRVAVGVAVGF
jgi:hypothetical protein